MVSRVGWLAFGVAIVAVFVAFVSVNDAQIIVERGSGGPVSGVYQVLGQLSDEAKWEEARDKLVQMAKEGERFEVIFSLDSFASFRPDAVLKKRAKAVFEKLEEEGLYPINSKDVQGMIDELRNSLAQVEQLNKEKECPLNAVRMLHSTSAMLETAIKQIENPTEGRAGAPSGGMRRFGGGR